MTELHNMSVPPRTVLTVRREQLRGRRYRIDLWRSVTRQKPSANAATVLRNIRNDRAYLLGLIEGADPAPRARRPRRDTAEELERLCGIAIGKLQLPHGFGFFVDESDAPDDRRIATAAAIAILAARSGPLYLPGRFEPSLIDLCPVTLFFPFGAGDPITSMKEDAR